MRVAVVGSGPAGFYVTAPLLAAGAHVDLIERLPVPWGLVRFGVAPDHPEIKAVSRVFEKTAAEPNFRFFGNIDIGKSISPAGSCAISSRTLPAAASVRVTPAISLVSTVAIAKKCTDEPLRTPW